jgi:ABC-type Zn2+ transport system substrate-binding protein/surface adhesin
VTCEKISQIINGYPLLIAWLFENSTTNKNKMPVALAESNSERKTLLLESKIYLVKKLTSRNNPDDDNDDNDDDDDDDDSDDHLSPAPADTDDQIHRQNIVHLMLHILVVNVKNYKNAKNTQSLWCTISLFAALVCKSQCVKNRTH